MDNIHVPTHEAHLQTKYRRVATLVGQEEFHGITIRDPDKTLAEYVVPHLVNCIITRKAFAQVRMQPNFVSAAFPSPKSDEMERGRQFLGHEQERLAIPIILCCSNGCIIVSWLEEHVTKLQSGEVGPKHHQLMIIKSFQARVGDDRGPHVLPRGVSSIRPERFDGVGIFMLGELE